MVRTERMMISVSPRGRKALFRLAAATKKPMSTVVGELVDEAAPMLEALAAAAETVKAQRGDAYRTLAQALAETQLSAAQLSVDFHSQRPAPGKKKGGK